MPIAGNTWKQDGEEAAYFKSLEELDNGMRTAMTPDHNCVLPYRSRYVPWDAKAQGKLLVCHDYKGGYTETPFQLSYTFNFWSRCDIFVYFAHHRITVPPAGWINAAHRHGSKILGTIIFEGDGEPDCLRLLVGQLPTSKTGPAQSQSQSSSSLPISPHYARVLAVLAHQRGFDGYLLNFECPLRGGIEQTQALTHWISLLQRELRSKVGEHAEVIWYDSVIVTGQLAWQDRLNAANLPFFLPSSGFFTNYTWPREYPGQTAQYFASIDSALTTDISDRSRQKSLNDVYVGVDVWGRGSHGGGGLGSYRAIEHIAPESLGLSVALFGQAWTWETEQDKPGFSWETWWEYERKLWVGPVTGDVKVPEAPKRKGEPECIHGPFVPLSSFFLRLSPPDPASLAFHTTFCPGVGRKWFVNGIQVFDRPEGWTDIDKQTSLGDMVWPRPTLSWEGEERTEKVPDALAELCMVDAWNGSSSLRLSVSCDGCDEEDAYFRQLWLPIQSLVTTPDAMYQAIAIYKLEHHQDIEVDVGLTIKSAQGVQVEVVPDPASPLELESGWIKISAQFTIDPDATRPSPSPVEVYVGLTMAIATEDPKKPLTCSILLGQLNVFPAPSTVPLPRPQILWVDFQLPSKSEYATLTWEVATSSAVPQVVIGSVDDPVPAWIVSPADVILPAFLYFNIYAQESDAQGTFLGPEKAVWIGTSGLNGMKQAFTVHKENLPFAPSDAAKRLRFYVQGVTEFGEVLSWDQCSYVEAHF